MPALRDRPWTWGFLILTLGIDVLIVLEVEYIRSTGVEIAIGQAIVVGAWFGLGSAHRLVRATIFIGASLALAYLLSNLATGSVSSNWKLSLTLTMVTQTAAALAALIVLTIQAWLTRASRHNEGERPSFRIGEILAWTGLVAVASPLLRGSPILDLATHPRMLAFVATGFLGGVSCVMLSGRKRPALRVGIPVAVCAVALSFQAWPHWKDVEHVATVYAYVGCYLTCCLLDKRTQTANAVADSD